MVVDNLRHGRRHTAYHAVFVLIYRAIVIVRCTLIPLRSHHRGDGHLHAATAAGIGGRGGHTLVVMLAEPLHLAHIALQPHAHICWHRLVAIRTLVAIGQHRAQTVVAAHHHVALLLSDVHGIQQWLLALVGSAHHGFHLERQHGGGPAHCAVLCAQPLPGHLAGLFLTDGASPHHQRG